MQLWSPSNINIILFFFFQNILFLPDLAAASFSVFNEFAGESS